MNNGEPGWALSRLKRWWVPEWLFSLGVHLSHFLETDIAEMPWLRMFLTTDKFHYHDVGRPIHGKRCRRCVVRSQNKPIDSTPLIP